MLAAFFYVQILTAKLFFIAMERMYGRCLSVYYGWIITATMTNVCVLLTKIGWNGRGLSPGFWTVAVLLNGAVIASAVGVIGGNRNAGLAVMWAPAGILVRHISVTYYAGSHSFVIVAGFLSEAVILAVILIPVKQIIVKMRYVSAHYAAR